MSTLFWMVILLPALLYIGNQYDEWLKWRDSTPEQWRDYLHSKWEEPYEKRKRKEERAKRRAELGKSSEHKALTRWNGEFPPQGRSFSEVAADVARLHELHLLIEDDLNSEWGAWWAGFWFYV